MQEIDPVPADTSTAMRFGRSRLVSTWQTTMNKEYFRPPEVAQTVSKTLQKSSPYFLDSPLTTSGHLCIPLREAMHIHVLRQLTACQGLRYMRVALLMLMLTM